MADFTLTPANLAAASPGDTFDGSTSVESVRSVRVNS